MKIKIVRRFGVSDTRRREREVYDIYHGFTGLPLTWPFCTKWVIDKSGLSEEELVKWIKNNCISVSPKVIIKY